MFARKLLNAARPPADAPMPTINGRGPRSGEVIEFPLRVTAKARLSTCTMTPRASIHQLTVMASILMLMDAFASCYDVGSGQNLFAT
jgi:hypothetical protein